MTEDEKRKMTEPPMRERLARAICGYFDDLPDVATYLQRKASTRDFEDKADVFEAVDAILAEMENLSEGVRMQVDYRDMASYAAMIRAIREGK